MVIGHICTQGFFLHWKTLDQLAGSFSCIDTIYCVIHSFVCLLVLWLSRSFVRWLVRLFARPSFLPFVRSYVKFVCLFVYSFVHSIDSWIDRSFVWSFLVFRQVLCSSFSPIVHSKMVSLCLGSSRIPTNDFFHFNRWLFPWYSIAQLCSFPFLHQSRADAWWPFSCKNKLILS